MYTILNTVCDPTDQIEIGAIRHRKQPAWLAILFSLMCSAGALCAIDAVDGGGGGPTWGIPPSAFLPRTEFAAALGTSFTLAATVDGTAPISVQWYHNNTAIPGATRASLTIGPIAVEDAGEYYLAAANAWGRAASLVANVRVAPVVLTTQPQSKTLVLGASTRLSVAAKGVGPLSYQWFFNQSPIPAATSPDLLIPKASLSNDGSYYAMVSNAKGTVVTTNVEVVVTAPPAIQQQPRSQVVSPGELVSLSVEVIGRGPFDYLWSENGSSAAHHAHLEKSDTYTFRAPMVATTLTYTVTVANPWSYGVFGEPSVSLPVVVHVSDDVDGDEIPDVWERAHGLDPRDPLDAIADLDGDGVSNRDEALAGTDPNDAFSTMRLRIRQQPAAGGLMFDFEGRRDRTYAIQAKDEPTGEWLTQREFPAQVSDGLVTFSTEVLLDQRMRLYRLVTPAP